MDNFNGYLSSALEVFLLVEVCLLMEFFLLIDFFPFWSIFLLMEVFFIIEVVFFLWNFFWLMEVGWCNLSSIWPSPLGEEYQLTSEWASLGEIQRINVMKWSLLTIVSQLWRKYFQFLKPHAPLIPNMRRFGNCNDFLVNFGLFWKWMITDLGLAC